MEKGRKKFFKRETRVTWRDGIGGGYEDISEIPEENVDWKSGCFTNAMECQKLFTRESEKGRKGKEVLKRSMELILLR